MREFYVYGFKSREEYNGKSARSYDDERRRMESWLGDHMSFVRTPEGKNVFISIDSRVSCHNPLYKALKAKSFTDKDITLHFILFDILCSPEVTLSLCEILGRIDEYLSGFDAPMLFDESTLRKKLKEYTELGLISSEKKGKKMFYRRTEDIDIDGLNDVLNFYSEVSPCGAVGSFLLDKYENKLDTFNFKHHYITSAIDTGVLADLFDAMSLKSIITVTNTSRFSETPKRIRLIPLRIFISVQSGRQHLLAYESEYNRIRAFRVDYLSEVKNEGVTPRFDELRCELDGMQSKMWGVTASRDRFGQDHLESVEFTVRVGENEEHIVRRLEREKRIGCVEKTDDESYRFTVQVYETSELIPWIRTFICRITDLNFSNKALERQFKNDIEAMYRMYGIEESEE
ncbi:MAG: WYL domain-containing protein [Ruminococcaceae bacterium]|nr:WYL domain-containing protein [Oscillospiraceae bacterium]